MFLLGTVLGVLFTFRVISVEGMTGPDSFAEGISLALITTIGGMGVSIPHFIGHSFLVRILDKIEARLEKNVLEGIL